MAETMSLDKESLIIDLDMRSYPVHIGAGFLTQAGQLVHQCSQARRAYIVSNEKVAPLYQESLQRSLTESDIKSETIILPDGEQYKNWDELYKILSWLLESRAERHTPLIALGGGVIGDITGLAAALYQRGMPLIQIPTSLLAQVDSSVGGKTAVNHPLGKNMIGAFYQPKLVLIDTETLNTLPEREYISGIAEIVKYGAIYDIHFFEWLEKNKSLLLARDATALQYAIRTSCRIKAEIVAADEQENNVRAILNLGHTFGHVIETALGYGAWLHGEAVAAGMVLAARLSEKTCGFSREESARLTMLLRDFGLPTISPEIPLETWLQLMQHDKKTQQGQLRFVLLERLGNAKLRSGVEEKDLRQVLVKTMQGSSNHSEGTADQIASTAFFFSQICRASKKRIF